MKMRLVLLWALAAAASADKASVEAATKSGWKLIEEFQAFIHKFEKSYESVEEMIHRMKVFHQNGQHAAKMQAADDGATYSHFDSPLADMSQEEFTARNNLKVPKDILEAPKGALLSTDDLPKSWDWREKGAVNPPKDQAQCGSCWSFGTVANIEGARVVQAKQDLLSLSEQELVDCDKATGDMGCNGGLPTKAMDDMIKNKFGLMLEKDYPYTAREGKCVKKSESEKVFIDGFVNVPMDEDQIAAYLVKYGPLVIGINAGPMQMYAGGIANPWTIFCNPFGIDHAVVIVGYGEENGKKYWIIRNSWGERWGEKGYYRIIRGVGKCGLNRMVSTATFKAPEAEAQTEGIYV